MVLPVHLKVVVLPVPLLGTPQFTSLSVPWRLPLALIVLFEAPPLLMLSGLWKRSDRRLPSLRR